MPKSCSKATCISTSCAPKARSAITPVSTRSKIYIPYSMSAASRIARIPFTRRPSWASRRMEDGWMGKAVERIFLPLMKLTIPEIVDINLPVEGVFHNLMLVSIQKIVSRAGPQGDECHLVAGAGDVHQVHHRG